MVAGSQTDNSPILLVLLFVSQIPTARENVNAHQVETSCIRTIISGNV